MDVSLEGKNTNKQDVVENCSANNCENGLSENTPKSEDFNVKPEIKNLCGEPVSQIANLGKPENEHKNISDMPLSENGKENFVQEVCFNFVKEDKYKDNLSSNVTDTDAPKEVIDDEENDTTCGIGSFRPQWIQKYATSRVYLVLFCIIGVLQGSYYTYFIGTLSTVEKRFAFKSKTSGSILIVDEISPLILGVTIGYFGGKAHRIRLIAIGMFLSTLSCFVTAFPYFIYGSAQHLTSMNAHAKGDQELCDHHLGMDTCDSDDRPPTLMAIFLFIIAHFLKGFGTVSYHTVGFTYMDDNAKKKNSPMYFAITFALRLLGPLLGFLMSSAFLKLYENPFVDPGFGPDDPRWIGAWWIGYCLQGILLAIFTFPIFLFPRRLKSHRKPTAKTSNKEKESLLSLVLGFFRTMKKLARNPVFILIVLNAVLEIGSFGHYIMLPKYMENAFKLSASDSSLYSGPPGIISVMVSIIAGGFILWKYRPKVKTVLMGMVVIQLLSAVGYLILIIPKCENAEMNNFGMDEKGLILEGPCNANCSCTTNAFTPVCGSDGKTTYFTPCYAGCQATLSKSSTSTEKKEFFDCSCLNKTSGENTYDAIEGMCVDEGCWSQALAYIILFPILQLIASVLRVSHTILLFRSVHPDDKSAAVGAFESLISLLGFLPYLVIFGSLVDSACIVWEENCGETGNCWFYDMDRFSYLLHGSSALCAFLIAVCCLGIYFLSDRIRDLYEDEEDEGENSKVAATSKGNKPTNVDTKL